MQAKYHLTFNNTTAFRHKTINQAKLLAIARKEYEVSVKTNEMFNISYNLTINQQTVTVNRFVSGHPKPDVLVVYSSDTLQATFYPQSQTSLEMATMLLLPFIIGAPDSL